MNSTDEPLLERLHVMVDPYIRSCINSNPLPSQELVINPSNDVIASIATHVDVFNRIMRLLDNLIKFGSSGPYEPLYQALGECLKQNRSIIESYVTHQLVAAQSNAITLLIAKLKPPRGVSWLNLRTLELTQTPPEPSCLDTSKLGPYNDQYVKLFITVDFNVLNPVFSVC